MTPAVLPARRSPGHPPGIALAAAPDPDNGPIGDGWPVPLPRLDVAEVAEGLARMAAEGAGWLGPDGRKNGQGDARGLDFIGSCRLYGPAARNDPSDNLTEVGSRGGVEGGEMRNPGVAPGARVDRGQATFLASEPVCKRPVGENARHAEYTPQSSR